MNRQELTPASTTTFTVRLTVSPTSKTLRSRNICLLRDCSSRTNFEPGTGEQLQANFKKLYPLA